MSNDKQLTSIDWLEREIQKSLIPAQKDYFKWAFEQAKAMEKQQIIDTWMNGAYSIYTESAEEYYKQEYESKESDKCCTPKGQIKRYIDCIGCDKNPKNNIK